MTDDIELKRCAEFARNTIAVAKKKNFDGAKVAACFIREALAMLYRIDPGGANAENLALHVNAYAYELMSQAIVAGAGSKHDREWLNEHYARLKAQTSLIQLQDALVKRAQKTVLESGKLQANKVKETLP